MPSADIGQGHLSASRPPASALYAGLTLTDTIRHEYAHAWFYLDSALFRQDWLVRTFGAAYSNLDPLPYQGWRRNCC